MVQYCGPFDLTSPVYTHVTYAVESPSIEESPKWHLLSMVLDEIRKESVTDTESECVICF